MQIKKISVVSPGLFPFLKGGAETQMHYLCDYLSNNGIDVTVITLNHGYSDLKVTYKIKKVGFGSGKILFLTSIFHFWILKKNNILFFSQFTSLTFFWMIFSIRKIIILRLSNSGDLFDIKRVFSGRFNYLVKIILKYKVNKFIAISDVIKSDLISHGFKQVIRLNNLVPSNDFLIEDSFRIVFVGRFVPHKNFDFLIKLCSMGFSDEVHIYGERTSSFQIISKRLLKFKNLIIRDLFIDKSYPYIGSRPIILHPSLYEGTSNAILEALSFGVPVIANEIPANLEFEKDGRNGVIIIPTNNPEAWIETIEKLKNDRNYYFQMSKNAKTYIFNNHNALVIGDSYIKSLF
jgi:glycosyltransferase involved in cell wall biosynthesis